MAHPTRFELVTSAFGGQRSIQLSYGCLAEAEESPRRKSVAGRPIPRFITDASAGINGEMELRRPPKAEITGSNRVGCERRPMSARLAGAGASEFFPAALSCVASWRTGGLNGSVLAA